MTNPIHESAKDMARHWRTMESAPLSQECLVYAHPVVGQARFYMGSNRDGDWYWAGTSPMDSPVHICFPTHWMPLPAAPV